MKKINLLFATFIFFTSLISNAVWNGTDSKKSISKNVVRIKPFTSTATEHSETEEDLICSAVFLRSNILITAAHCVEYLIKANTKKINIENPTSNNISKYSVSRVIRHPDYKIGFRNNPDQAGAGTDVALIILKKDYNYPVENIDIASKIPESAFLIANGFYAKDTPETPNKELNVSIKRLNQDLLKLSPQQEKASACHNDSGGGYFTEINGKFALVSIQSSKAADYPCGSDAAVSFGSNISENSDWIRSVINPIDPVANLSEKTKTSN